MSLKIRWSSCKYCTTSWFESPEHLFYTNHSTIFNKFTHFWNISLKVKSLDLHPDHSKKPILYNKLPQCFPFRSILHCISYRTSKYKTSFVRQRGFVHICYKWCVSIIASLVGNAELLWYSYIIKSICFIYCSWLLEQFLCKMYMFIQSLSSTASIFILVVICIERYFAIIYPITCKQILTPIILKVSFFFEILFFLESI